MKKSGQKAKKDFEEAAIGTLENLSDRTFKFLQDPFTQKSGISAVLADIANKVPDIVGEVEGIRVFKAMYSAGKSVKTNHEIRKFRAVLQVLEKSNFQDRSVIATLSEKEKSSLLEQFLLSLVNARSTYTAEALTYLWISLLKGNINQNQFTALCFSIEQINPVVFTLTDNTFVLRREVLDGGGSSIEGFLYYLPSAFYSPFLDNMPPTIGLATPLGIIFMEEVYQPMLTNRQEIGAMTS